MKQVRIEFCQNVVEVYEMEDDVYDKFEHMTDGETGEDIRDYLSESAVIVDHEDNSEDWDYMDHTMIDDDEDDDDEDDDDDDDDDDESVAAG